MKKRLLAVLGLLALAGLVYAVIMLDLPGWLIALHAPPTGGHF